MLTYKNMEYKKNHCDPSFKILNLTFNQERKNALNLPHDNNESPKQTFATKQYTSRGEKKYIHVHAPTGITTISCMHNRD